MRGIAALMVVAFHAGYEAERHGVADVLPDWLRGGVDIFFVISGCLMWITTAPPYRNVSPTAFWWKRIKRIVPLYWLITTITVLVMVATPSVVRSGRLDAWHIISSYLFLPSLHPVTGGFEPVVIPGWTLNYEMFFYAIFGLLLFAPARFRLWALVGIFTSLVAAGLLHDWSPKRVVSFYTAPIIIEFAIGSVPGWLFMKNRLLSVPTAWMFICLGALAFPIFWTLIPDAPWIIKCGLPAIAIVAGALSLDRHQKVGLFRIPHLLGDASYSIYLSHGMTLSALSQIYFHLGLHDSLIFFPFLVVSGLLASAIVGLAIYFMFERPVMKVDFNFIRQGA